MNSIGHAELTSIRLATVEMESCRMHGRTRLEKFEVSRPGMAKQKVPEVQQGVPGRRDDVPNMHDGGQGEQMSAPKTP